MTMESDPSNMGWGAQQGEQQTGEMIQRGSLTPYKLSGIVGSLPDTTMFCQTQPWCDHSDETGQCHSSDIHKQVGGNTLTPTLSACSNHMGLEHTENIFLVAEHLPGKDNLVANQESRSMKDRCDWMLNPVMFNQIQLQMGPLEIDLFASRLTKQPPQFYSWRPDPEAQGTDAFNQDWSKMRGFANPPWCMIGRCQSQVKRQVARIVMITPLWTSQPWYLSFLGMLEDFPRLLPERDDLVTLQSEQGFIMSQRMPRLVAWSISGNPLHQEEFLQRLQTSYFHLGDQKLSQTITCLQSGPAGVQKGIGIPLWDL